MTESERRTLRLPEDLVDEIEKAAKAENVDFSEAARRLLKAGVRSRRKEGRIGEFKWKKKETYKS